MSSGDGPEPAGDARSEAELGSAFVVVYEELRAIAGGYLRQERAGHTLQPTALVHEAFGRLASYDGPWTDEGHFRALVARVMRQVLVDHARSRGAIKRGGDGLRLTLSGSDAEAATPIDVLELDELLTELSRLDERKARVVELLFFGGLTQAQAASLLDLSKKTIENDWYFARAWLGARLRPEAET